MACSWSWSCGEEESRLGTGHDVTHVVRWLAQKRRDAGEDECIDGTLNLAILLGDECPRQRKVLRRTCPNGSTTVLSTSGPGHEYILHDRIEVLAPPELSEDTSRPPLTVGRRASRRLSGPSHSSSGLGRLLSSDEIVLTFMSTSKSKYWQTRAVAAWKSWASNFANIFYVMEDSELTTKLFSREECRKQSKDFGFTMHTCKGEPPALVVPCSGEYYGATGPCCKFDAATTYMVNAVKPGGRFEALKWWMFGDDDNFIFIPNYMQMLSRLDYSRPQYRSPVRPHQKPHLQIGMWHHNPQCEHLISQRIAQPLVLSITALRKLEVVAGTQGTTRICKDWDITHDWGCALLFWQMGFEWGPMIGVANPDAKYYVQGAWPSTPTAPHLNDTVFVHASKRTPGGEKIPGVLDFEGLHAFFKDVGPDHIAVAPTAANAGWANWETARPLKGYNETIFAQSHPAGGNTFTPFPPDRCCKEHAPQALFAEGKACDNKGPMPAILTAPKAASKEHPPHINAIARKPKRVPTIGFHERAAARLARRNPNAPATTQREAPQDPIIRRDRI